MSKSEVSENRLTLPQVKKLLETIGEENLDQFQRRTFDYVSKFSKTEPEKAEDLLQKLTKDYEIDEVEAVQIINCMPQTVDELRVFLAGGKKIIEAQKLSQISELLNESRLLK
ncbi:MAG: RNA polymerase Rpb4 [Nitrososphaerota archaeon]|jgi:DNA-directed RNA polymerase subunit F|uniref:RNA polymerase Rpb4 n=1 Tax=Candidatus Bathycorpusculum sp. TaxID=2994959 RepID=UPI0028392022|nr:RNA polymerase Rpb4 [Candidatus Termitimicrobium sp.]MCL2431381.1 RNA polymerase Rpb4 [Candidatus Termitimicrobium sp.]MDR0492067.1 RNA polymerase Rpb4 [Nitrososphaerota archaeon]